MRILFFNRLMILDFFVNGLLLIHRFLFFSTERTTDSFCSRFAHSAAEVAGFYTHYIAENNGLYYHNTRNGANRYLSVTI
jgi:hypothetical protein